MGIPSSANPPIETKMLMHSRLMTMHASDNIVFTENPTKVALLGVHNLIVIRTGDTILVCNRRDAERVKDLVAQLPPELQ